jgi:hypothetical protein
MTRRSRLIAVVALGAALVLGAAARGFDSSPGTRAAAAADLDHAEHASGSSTPNGDRIDPITFHADMRKLWEDHVTWTRLYIVSAIARLPDVDATAGRLLQNQDDIANAMAAFYGDDAGHTFGGLLRDHIAIAGELVAAAKSGDQAAVATQHDRWYANADQIAEFLADANPAWPVDTVERMMRTHLDQTLAEATARLQGDWIADIAAYDEIHLHILDMADALADGIVAQFPDRFAA